MISLIFPFPLSLRLFRLLDSLSIDIEDGEGTDEEDDNDDSDDESEPGAVATGFTANSYPAKSRQLTF